MDDDKKTICYTHKKFKTSIASQTGNKNVFKVIKLKQNVWLKRYIDLIRELRKNLKNDVENHFFQVDE